MPNDSSQILRKIDFGNEAGDDESAEALLGFFVEQSSFYQFTDPTNRIRIATAKKGVGKSALIRWIGVKVKEEHKDEVLIISCRGSDLVRSNFKLSSTPTTPSEHIQDWKVRICAFINRRIGAEIGIAFGDDAITLVESAELDGFKQHNLMSALADRLKKLIPYANAEKLHAVNEVELLRRFEGRNIGFWLMILMRHISVLNARTRSWLPFLPHVVT